MSILILSSNDDITTDKVIDWILHFNKKPFRVDFENFLRNSSISIDLFNKKTRIKDNINKEFVEAAWFRMDTRNDFYLDEFSEFNNIRIINNYLRKEIITAKSLFLSNNNIKWLSEYETVNLNKYKVLEVAKQIGLKTPKTIITNNKYDLTKFAVELNIEEFICKSIAENLSIQINNEYTLQQSVEEFNITRTDSFPTSFMPTMFQEKISKKVDLRVFFLNGKCYSMSIHSNMLDYRENYNNVRYNPIKLPELIESKITLLMKHLNLKTGSLDFIEKNDTSELFFLEINPNGQFGNVSNYCNYNLEKKIAKYLCYEN